MSDPYCYFPAWFRRAQPASLLARPMFFVGTWGGWGDVVARAGRLGIEVHGLTEWIPEYMMDGVMWRAAPRLRKLLGLQPDRFAGLEGTLLGLFGRTVGLGRKRAPILSTNQWLERAKATPGSISIVAEEGELARRYIRMARDAGIDAMYLSEALRITELRELGAGPNNDLIGDMPRRIDEFLALEDLFADAESIDVLHRTLQYRMTHHKPTLEPIVQGGCRKYFPIDLFPFSDRDRFIDVGGFTGDSVRTWFDVTDGRFAQVISLEPDDHNYFFLSKYRASLPPADRERVVCLKVGAWHEQTRLSFAATATGGSTIGAGGTSSIEVTTLDAISDEYGPPTIIKCEAEGSDREALTGCARTMRLHRPRMAITAYHLWDDYLALIPLVRGPNPDYKLSLRHYGLDHSGTTLYAY